MAGCLLMKTELVEISAVEKELKIEIEPQVLRAAYDKISQRYARVADVPGFRRGNAPISLVRNRYKEEIKSDVLREVVPERVSEAIQEHGINPLSEPDLHIENVENVKLDGSQPLSMHVHLEVMPELETPNYKGLEGVRRMRPLDENVIDEMINEKRRGEEFFEPAEDRPAQDGDTIIVDLHGKFADQPETEPLDVENMEILLDSGNKDDLFTEHLLSVTVDEERTFTVDYPENFPSEGLAGKTVEFTARVNSIGVKQLPELNDEWVKSLDEEFESVTDLREKLRQDLEDMSKYESDNRLRDELVGQLIDTNPIEVPKIFVQRQAEALLNNFAMEMQRRGADIQRAKQDFWEVVFRSMLPQAEREVKGAFLLGKVAEAENIEISDEELNEEIENIARLTQQTPQDVRRILESGEGGGENNLIERLRTRKAVDAVVENAVITDGEWVEENPELEAEPVEATADESETSPDSSTES
jgi:trigger factor